MLVPTSAEARRKRRLPAALMLALFYGITGLIGCVLLGMWLFSAHTFWYGNLTLLLCSPLALVAAVVGTRAVWRGERGPVALFVVGAVAACAALAALLAAFVSRRLGGPLFLLLPAHLGLALVFWRHTAPSVTAR